MPTNVLVDRHHAGLLRSLQLLAARLDWALYVPVGLDWMTEGYWNFGQNVPGLTADLAQQYLVPHEGVWQPLGGGGLWSTHDPEFPDVLIVGVELGTARLPGMPWSHVIASLDDNQHGFARFATEVGAQYVAQVGNTRQFIDWSLDPLALVSSEVPIRGRGVYYHQEMDPAATAFFDPRRITFRRPILSSMVNCFPSIGRCYDLWRQMQVELPEGGFWEWGIDGAQGVIKPISDLYAAMAKSTFGWHDKVHGDGFGHVIHGWAAVGRPIIGHGHHYAGKMGEVFWDDLVTCIDLDKHTIPETVALIREISADPDRHAEMCHAIRAVFDLIDYDAEEQAIRELLGLKA